MDDSYIYVISIDGEKPLVKVGQSMNPYARVSHIIFTYGWPARLELAVRCVDNPSLAERSAHGMLSDHLYSKFNGSFKTPKYFGLEVFDCDKSVAFDAVMRAVGGEVVGRDYVSKYYLDARERHAELKTLSEGDLFYSSSMYVKGVFEYLFKKGPKTHAVKSLGDSDIKVLSGDTNIIKVVPVNQ